MSTGTEHTDDAAMAYHEREQDKNMRRDMYTYEGRTEGGAHLDHVRVASSSIFSPSSPSILRPSPFSLRLLLGVNNSPPAPTYAHVRVEHSHSESFGAVVNGNRPSKLEPRVASVVSSGEDQRPAVTVPDRSASAPLPVTIASNFWKSGVPSPVACTFRQLQR